MAGDYDAHFPIDIFQGGGGTSTNMNMNEVIANRANELITGKRGYDEIHPNTHYKWLPRSVNIGLIFYLLIIINSKG